MPFAFNVCGSGLVFVENSDVMATVSTSSNSLGEMLRRARELRGLTLERIARETKIPQRHLEAFEGDNLTAVPSGFYQRAELRTYAQAVGLDQRLALAELESALAPVDTRGPRETRQIRGGQAATSALPYLAAAAVAGIAVMAALFDRPGVESAPQLEPRVETPAAADSAPTPGTVAPETAASSVAPQVLAGPTQAAVPVRTESVTAVVVKTQPEGARVTVNGIGWGSSPATIQYLEPGQKRIRVSKEGYVAVERVLQVDEGRRLTLDIRLERAP
jgi:cytoskeletal protein RodZ